MGKKLVIAIIILAILGFVAYKFLYKKHRDISSEAAEFTLSVNQIQQEFVTDANLANSKYADKTIEVKGNVTSVDLSANSIVVDEKLSAVLKDKLGGDISENSPIKIKGRFVGYDDLLEELKMDQVTIIK